jgi:hypothetical protein
MLSVENNELLTRVGPGTPFGQKIETLYGKRTSREHFVTCHHVETS